LPPRPVEAAKTGAHPSANPSLESEEIDDSSDEESSIGQLETSEALDESSPELAAASQEGHSVQTALDETNVGPQPPADSAASETVPSASLPLPSGSPDPQADSQEPLERVATHSN
jgi:hypothetical protein